jgi:putative flippase GtrA
MNRKGFKYISAGLASWVVDYGTLMFLFYVLHFRLEVATTAAFIAGFVVNFTLVKYWVFGKSARNKQAVLAQGSAYIVLTAFNLLVTNLIIVFLAKRNIGPAVSKIFTTALIALWNFFIYRRLIFKEDEDNKQA